MQSDLQASEPPGYWAFNPSHRAIGPLPEPMQPANRIVWQALKFSAAVLQLHDHRGAFLTALQTSDGEIYTAYPQSM